MTDPVSARRHSLRLKAHDYAWTGSYFVTICVDDRSCRFGHVANGACLLSDAGLMVESWWGNIERRFPSVSIDAYVVMPNHLHGIIRIGWGREDGDNDETRDLARTGDPMWSPLRSPVPVSGTIDPGTAPPVVGATRRGRPVGDGRSSFNERVTFGDIIGWFKTMTTRDYAVGVRDYGWPPYDRRLWQRNYYEHVVRDERDLDRIRAYVDANPGRWVEDEDYRP